MITNDYSELHYELIDYVENDEVHGLILKHPLIFKLPLLNSQIKQVNKMYCQKQDKVDEAYENDDYLLFTMLHERPWRSQVLFDLEGEIKDKKLLMEITSQVWMDSENNCHHWEEWNDFFNRNLKFNRDFMNSDDLEVYNNLGQEITVYHGGSFDKALSWTLDKRKAEYFMNRFNTENQNKLFTKIIDKEMIFAYVNQRNEKEVILMR